MAEHLPLLRLVRRPNRTAAFIATISGQILSPTGLRPWNKSVPWVCLRSHDAATRHADTQSRHTRSNQPPCLPEYHSAYLSPTHDIPMSNFPIPESDACWLLRREPPMGTRHLWTLPPMGTVQRAHTSSMPPQSAFYPLSTFPKMQPPSPLLRDLPRLSQRQYLMQIVKMSTTSPQQGDGAGADATDAASTSISGTSVGSMGVVTPPPLLLVVHPRYRGMEDRKEALRLAESLTGQPCPFLEVGGSRLRPRRSASQPFSMTRGSEFSGLRSTYFGSGTMEELARQLELLGRNTTNREQAQRKTGGKKQEVGGGNGLVEPVAVEEEAEAVSGDGKGGGSSAFSGNVGSESGSGGGGDEGVPRVPAFINEVLTPLQERNIELGLGRPVLDRVGLILRLFAQRAHTREARLQVELASLSYMLPRLVRTRGADGRRTTFGVGAGWGGLNPELEGPALQVVSARQRGSSGAGGLGGGGGSGDPELRQQRFRIKQRLAILRQELKAVAASRGVQRQGRRAAGLPTVAIVGYTNVGKTSLVGAMCSSDAGVQPPSDMLFATLDPAVRRVWLPTRQSHVAVSDTVGFIRDLPVGLVASFRATLEEVVAADMLIHVLDASSPMVVQQRAAVLAVLRQLGVSEHMLNHRTIEVWNKVDLMCKLGGSDTEHGIQIVRQPYVVDSTDDATHAGISAPASESGADAVVAQEPATEVVAWDEDFGADEEEEDIEDTGIEMENDTINEVVPASDGDRVHDESSSHAGLEGYPCGNKQHQHQHGTHSPPRPRSAILHRQLSWRFPGLTSAANGAAQIVRPRNDGVGGVCTVVHWDEAPGGQREDIGGGPASYSHYAGAVTAPPTSGIGRDRDADTDLQRMPSGLPAQHIFHEDTACAAEAELQKVAYALGRCSIAASTVGEVRLEPSPQRIPPSESPSPPPPPLPQQQSFPRTAKSMPGGSWSSGHNDGPVSTSKAASVPPHDSCVPSILRKLHSSSAVGTFISETSLGAEVKANHGDGLTAGGLGIKLTEEEQSGGGAGRGGEAGSWRAAACLAAAADMVRQVHAANGSAPVAVVLTAIAAEGGGGVEEVKMAVDAILRTAGLQAVAGLQPVATARGVAEGKCRTGRAERGGIRRAASVDGKEVGSVAEIKSVEAEAEVMAAVGRWISPLLWLANVVPWPMLPLPQSQWQSRGSPTSCSSSSWSYSHQQTPSSGDMSQDGGSHQLWPRSAKREAPLVLADTMNGSEQGTGSAAVPDEEELKELIHFLRRRRPRGKRDD